VRGAADAPGAEVMVQFRFGEVPWACGGACSTALDMAIFGQMFLNRGVYGGVRVLSPATVAAMTRNQIPGISSNWFGEYFPEASLGLGWDVHGPKKCLAEAEQLSSAGSFGHGGWGHVMLCVDPLYELTMVCFSVLSWNGLPADMRAARDPYLADGKAHREDLFVSAATAAIVE